MYNVIDNKYSFYAISFEYLEDPESDVIEFPLVFLRVMWFES